ncbi:hypothetical protein D3C84_1187640 [compost metagenome]
MRADDFEQFFAERQQRLLAIVAQAMGKQADSSVPSLNDEEDFESEELEVVE